MAGRLANLFSPGTVTTGLPYFDYQRAVAREAVLPWLRPRVRLERAAVADFGAHQGGLLDEVRASTGAASGLGIELNEAVVASSPFVADERFRLEVGDLTALDPEAGPFDLIFLHDVLEHVVDVERVLAAAAARLTPEGRLFVAFPPYRGPFGGHQHLASGWARAAPYLHYLPGRAFFRLARPGANEYMSSADSLSDLVSVRRTRLTLGRAERAFGAAGLRVVARRLFLVRPEHTLRYGVPTVGAGPVGALPVLRELAVSGAYYLLARQPQPLGLRVDVTDMAEAIELLDAPAAR